MSDNSKQQGGYTYEPTRQRSLWDNVSEIPIVSIGALATTGALVGGLYSMMKGNQKWSQYMMRARVGLQFGTITALAVWLNWFYKSDKKKSIEPAVNVIPIPEQKQH